MLARGPSSNQNQDTMTPIRREVWIIRFVPFSGAHILDALTTFFDPTEILLREGGIVFMEDKRDRKKIITFPNNLNERMVLLEEVTTVNLV